MLMTPMGGWYDMLVNITIISGLIATIMIAADFHGAP